MKEEEIIFEVKRHPAGLAYIYITTLVAIGASLALVFWASGEIIELTDAQMTIAIIVMLSVAALVVLLLFIQTVIYWSNTFTLSDEEVRQNLQNGLFSRKISRLGLANIEDVTVEQKGFLATLFNYGTLRIETAGEQSNFTFKYCSNPNECSHKVMDAREKYLLNEHTPTRRADIQR